MDLWWAFFESFLYTSKSFPQVASQGPAVNKGFARIPLLNLLSEEVYRFYYPHFRVENFRLRAVSTISQSSCSGSETPSSPAVEPSKFWDLFLTAATIILTNTRMFTLSILQAIDTFAGFFPICQGNMMPLPGCSLNPMLFKSNVCPERCYYLGEK